MKIGFDAKRYYHNHTGLGNYSRTLVAGLQSQFPQHDYLLYDEKSLKRTFNLGMKAAADGCQIYHGLSNELPFDLHYRPTIEHNRGEHLRMPASVVTIHDICWRTFPEMYHFIDRKLYDWKYGSSCRRADKVIAISESTKRDIIEIYGVEDSRVEVICQPVAENFYTPLAEGISDLTFNGFQLPKDYVLYVGSINARKNLMGVLEAMALMPSERRPMLVVVGNGHEYKRKCEAFIESAGLKKNLLLLGNVNSITDLQKLYKHARLMVYPSFYEGFGLPVVEAALQHTPVITSSVSSLPEAAGPDACLINPHDADAAEQIAHYMDRLLTDEEYHNRVADRMEQYARRTFAPELQPQKIMKLYESLL